MPDWKLTIDAGASSGGTDPYGFSTGAYFAKLVTADWAYEFTGIGRVKDLSLFYARGIIDALDHLAREREATQLLPGDIICGGPGFWQRLKDTWRSELSSPSKVKTPDEHAIWLHLAQLEGLFDLQPPRGPSGTAEAAELSKVKAGRVRFVWTLCPGGVNLPNKTCNLP
jgi:hypothetical protein